MWKEYKQKWSKNYAAQFGERSGLRLLCFFFYILSVSLGFSTMWLMLIVILISVFAFLAQIGVLSVQTADTVGFVLSNALGIAYIYFSICTEAGNKLFLKMANAVEECILQAFRPTKIIFGPQETVRTAESIQSFKSHIPSLPYTPPRVHHV